MGLLDNLNDPQQQAILTMAMGLLGGKSARFGQNLSNAGMAGLGAYNAATLRQAKLAEEEQQKKLREFAIQEAQRNQGNRDYAARIAPQFFSSGTPPAPFNDSLGDGTQGTIPGQAPKLDLQGYGMALAQRDPNMGMPFIQAGMKDNTPITAKAGDTLLDRNTLKPIYTAPDKPHFVDAGDKVIPVDNTGRAVGPPIPKNLAPGEAQRLGISAAQLGIDKAKLGLDMGRYQYEIGNGQGLPKKLQDTITTDVNKKQAENQLQAKIELPTVEAEAKQVTGLVDQLVNHPGFKTSVGVKGPTGAMAAVGVPIPGTDAADWKALRDQIVGKQFMQAYSTLKGGGQITEVEGRKATDAIARMTTSQSEEDFKQAAEEFKSVINGALQRQRAKAGATGGWSIQRVP